MPVGVSPGGGCCAGAAPAGHHPHHTSCESCEPLRKVHPAMNRADRRRAVRAGKTTNPAAIIWMSNSTWSPTGYGTQTAQAVKRLQRDGHAVAVAANYGLEAMTTVYDGVPHFPRGYDTYSNDVIEPYFKDWSRQHPDLPPLCIALFDAWPLKGEGWNRMPVGIWTMVDHLPVPPAVLEFLRKPNVTPLAASRFAHEQIERAGVESIYVPMAIDTAVYRPTATWTNGAEVLTGRQLMGFRDPGDEDMFVVSCINANKSGGGGLHRKAWGENILAFSIFAARHDDVRLYIHTEKNGAHGGVVFDPLLAAVGLKPHQYRFVNQYAHLLGIPNEAMAALFTASDVLLAPTLGEGFGLTVLEAAACGTPTIVSDFTCQPELVGEGWLVDGQPFWDSLQSAWWQTPNVPSIVDALEAAYARGRGRSQKQIDHAAAYDADVVYDTYWKPAIARLLAEPSGAVEPLPTMVAHGNLALLPRLTIYVPTYRRASLADTLASLAPQLTAEVEVVVADNDPDQSGQAIVTEHLSGSDAHVTYIPRGTNIGGDENLLRGLSEGTAPWVWMVGDDDVILPGAVADVLEAISHDDIDRLILLSPDAPSGAAGMIGSAADLERAQPGLMVASTLITANVVRRSVLDLDLGRERIGTMYGWAWAHTPCRRVKVLASPAFVAGGQHAGEFAAQAGFTGDPVAVWTELLTQGYDVVPGEGSFSWNHVSVKASA